MFHVKHSKGKHLLRRGFKAPIIDYTNKRKETMQETLLNLVLSTVYMAAGVIGLLAYFDCLTY